MQKVFFFCLMCLNTIIVQSQDMCFVNATNGLIIREQPKTNAKRIGKLPYGSLVEVINKTNVDLQISDQGKVIKGEWFKVKFQNYPYLILENNEEYIDKGYVFSGYLEPLEKAKIKTTIVDSLEFFKSYKLSENKIIKIESQQEVEKLLGTKVTWKNVEFYGRQIDKIQLKNKQLLTINQDSFDCSFTAFYPTENIMLFEGGHSIDFSINIDTGELTETTGNPDYIIDSPNKTYRLNGWFGGQECSSYFIQKRKNDAYNYLVGFDDVICEIIKFYWLSDTEFLFSVKDYSDASNLKETYMKGQISSL